LNILAIRFYQHIDRKFEEIISTKERTLELFQNATLEEYFPFWTRKIEILDIVKEANDFMLEFEIQPSVENMDILAHHFKKKGSSLNCFKVPQTWEDRLKEFLGPCDRYNRIHPSTNVKVVEKLFGCDYLHWVRCKIIIRNT
jgi:hypothetical protein